MIFCHLNSALLWFPWISPLFLVLFSALSYWKALTKLDGFLLRVKNPVFRSAAEVWGCLTAGLLGGQQRDRWEAAWGWRQAMVARLESICAFMFCPQLSVFLALTEVKAFHMVLVVKKLPANPGDAGDQVWSLGQEDPLEEGMATHFSIHACLENPMVSRAWWVTDHRVAKSQTQLKWL